MHYKAIVTIPVSFEVEVYEKDLMIDGAEEALIEKAKEMFAGSLGNTLAVDYKEFKIHRGSIRGEYLGENYEKE